MAKRTVYFAKRGKYFHFFVLKFGILIIVRIFGQTKEQNDGKAIITNENRKQTKRTV